jgi:hypothetical protein
MIHVEIDIGIPKRVKLLEKDSEVLKLCFIHSRVANFKVSRF